MQAYDPLQRKYSGDGAMRVYTSQRKRNRSDDQKEEEEENGDISLVRRRTKGRPSRESVRINWKESLFLRKSEGENTRGYAGISLGWKNTSSQSQRQLSIVRLVKSVEESHIQCIDYALFICIVI